MRTDGGIHAFWWSPTSGMHDIGNIGDSFGAPSMITPRGQMPGHLLGADGSEHAVVWTIPRGA
jgi:hypothetical protein